MRWKISIEGSDEITRDHRFELEIEKSLDDLIAGNIGLSIDEGEGFCWTNRLMAGLPLSRTDLSHDLCDGDAERGEAVQHGDTNLELRHLTVEVARHEAMVRPAGLADLPALGAAILKGEVQGRVVVDVNA